MPEFVEGVAGAAGAAFVSVVAAGAGGGVVVSGAAAAAGAFVSVAGVELVSLLGLLQPVSAGRERAMKQRGRRDFMDEGGVGVEGPPRTREWRSGSTMTASGGVRKYFIHKKH
jgi:hypothetical protein